MRRGRENHSLVEISKEGAGEACWSSHYPSAHSALTGWAPAVLRGQQWRRILPETCGVPHSGAAECSQRSPRFGGKPKLEWPVTGRIAARGRNPRERLSPVGEMPCCCSRDLQLSPPWRKKKQHRMDRSQSTFPVPQCCWRRGVGVSGLGRREGWREGVFKISLFIR